MSECLCISIYCTVWSVPQSQGFETYVVWNSISRFVYRASTHYLPTSLPNGQETVLQNLATEGIDHDVP